MSFFQTLHAMSWCMFVGIRDSLRLPGTLVFFLSSATVRVRTAQCLVLNGVIFLGSLLLTEWALAPLVGVITRMMMGATMDQHRDNEEDQEKAAEWINILFLYGYQLLWVYPLYAISFLLSAIWYQDIADHSFVTHGSTSDGKGAPAAPAGLTFQRWVATMSDELYRLLLVTAFMAWITLLSFIPIVGNPLLIVNLCWLYSLYSFEYKWSLLGWSLEYRLKYLERHWCYFLGFGLPAVILSLVFPRFISLGIFALAFPIFIILAIIAHPVSHATKLRKLLQESGSMPPSSSSADSSESASSLPSSSSVPLRQLPIFRVATWMNWWLLRQLQKRATVTARPSTKQHAIPPRKSSMRPDDQD